LREQGKQEDLEYLQIKKWSEGHVKSLKNMDVKGFTTCHAIKTLAGSEV
jgi:hypothetical protein